MRRFRELGVAAFLCVFVRRSCKVGLELVLYTILIRQILKYAMERELLERLPIIPKVGKIVANPRPWLNADEWKHLLRVAGLYVGKKTQSL